MGINNILKVYRLLVCIFKQPDLAYIKK